MEWSSHTCICCTLILKCLERSSIDRILRSYLREERMEKGREGRRKGGIPQQEAFHSLHRIVREQRKNEDGSDERIDYITVESECSSSFPSPSLSSLTCNNRCSFSPPIIPPVALRINLSVTPTRRATFRSVTSHYSNHSHHQYTFWF